MMVLPSTVLGPNSLRSTRLWWLVPVMTTQSLPAWLVGLKRVRVRRQYWLLLKVMLPLEVKVSPSRITYAEPVTVMLPVLTTALPRLAARITMGASAVAVLVMPGMP